MKPGRISQDIRIPAALIGLFLFVAQSYTGSLCAQTNSAPRVTAEGDQAYCPLTSLPIATDFSITDPDDTGIEEFYIQISEGYEQGSDRLTLGGVHPNVSALWEPETGKLLLTNPAGGEMPYPDLIQAVLNVEFSSTLGAPAPEKRFSLTAASANYLPQTGHYYEFVPAVGISWTNARDAAANRTFFGLQGYLATITSEAEAVLTGEQSSGAGWIGGSDSAQEGVWKWMSGPEQGTTFWNGTANGSTTSYANWNTGEPNNLGEEDYAHITDPGVGRPGAWNDLSLTGATSGEYQPKGYIVEYGGLPGDPEVELSDDTRIFRPVIDGVGDIQLCGPGSITIRGFSDIEEVEYYWFENQEDTVPLATGEFFTTPFLDESRDFWVIPSIDGCVTGEKTRVPVTVNPLPEVPAELTLVNCDEDGLADGNTDFNLRAYTQRYLDNFDQFTISFHRTEVEAEEGLTPLDSSSYFSGLSDEVFARVENAAGCYSTIRYQLEVSTTSLPPGFELNLRQCDLDFVDGFYEFDLSLADEGIRSVLPSDPNVRISYYETEGDALLQQSPIDTSVPYRNLERRQQIYVRVENAVDGACFGLGPYVNIEVPLPQYELPLQATVCEGGTVFVSPEVIDQGSYTYEWRDASGLLISSEKDLETGLPGTYSFTLIDQNGCRSETQSTEVLLSAPPDLNASSIVVNDLSSTNSIELVEELLGPGDYEYALDSFGGAFQDSPVFDGVEPGFHILSVRDRNGCGQRQFQVGVVGALAYISPNGDGIQDQFELRGLSREFYASAEVFVYDRYGTLIAVFDPFEQGWDGRYGQVELPSTDYWFRLVITGIDGQVREKRGHFSLLR